MDTDWRDFATCAGMDPDLFYPTTDKCPPLEALIACASCPVRCECAEYATEHEPIGFWGGMNAKQRQDERGRRGLPEPSRNRQYIYAARNGAIR